MTNPWDEIDLSAYEKHMSLESVYQLQALNKMMKEQFYAYPVKSVMVLEAAGGNGLEHIDRRIIDKVYAVDINKEYLDTCKSRYPKLQDVLDTIHADLTNDTSALPNADIVIADLLIEYIGYECFKKTVRQVSPKYVSVIIQINENAGFVSDSPYIHVFDRLNEVHHMIDMEGLISAMEQIGYREALQTKVHLPNGKMLSRIDFTKRRSEGSK